MLKLRDFGVDTSEQVREAVLGNGDDLRSRLSNATRTEIAAPPKPRAGVERVADIPIHFSDPLVRRAASLQATADAKPPRARLSRTLLDQLGLQEGAQIKIRQGRGEAVLATQLDPGVPPGVVRIAAAHPSTCGLEGLSGPITVERA
jgi:NADH-quinone oxidoreductase subunit G